MPAGVCGRQRSLPGTGKLKAKNERRRPGTCEITRKYPAFILGSLNTALPEPRLWLSEDNQILKLIRRARVVAPKSRLEGVAEQSVTGDHGEQEILLVSHIGFLYLLV